MKRIYTAQDYLLIGHLKNVLETHGIDCMVKNMYLTSVAGEIPPIECWPELWVVNDSSYSEALTVLKRARAPLRPIRRPWRCGGCGEEVEGQFSECWNCGASRAGRGSG